MQGNDMHIDNTAQNLHYAIAARTIVLNYRLMIHRLSPMQLFVIQCSAIPLSSYPNCNLMMSRLGGVWIIQQSYKSLPNSWHCSLSLKMQERNYTLHSRQHTRTLFTKQPASDTLMSSLRPEPITAGLPQSYPCFNRLNWQISHLPMITKSA